MKNLLPLFCLTLCLAFNSFTFSQSPQERLNGKWHWISSSGGITGKGTIVKKGTVIEFTSDCRYNHYEKDTLKYSKTYSLLKATSKYGNRKNTDLIQFGNSSFKKSFSIRKNRLVLREPYPDGFTRIYQRVPPPKGIE